jgi:hypothetical protein
MNTINKSSNKNLARMMVQNERNIQNTNSMLNKHYNNLRNMRNMRNNNSTKPNKGFLDAVWGIPTTTKGNCYVFGLAPKVGPGGYTNKRLFKARPGDKCPHFKDAEFDFENCTDIVKRVLCDNPKHVTKLPSNTNIYMTMDDQHHMMAAVLSPGIHKDFHFLRRIPITDVYKAWDKLKYSTPVKCKQQLIALQPKYIWAHQRGWSKGGPIIHDSQGDLIIDPTMSNFKYPDLNYSIFCGLFKVRTRKATVYDYTD